VKPAKWDVRCEKLQNLLLTLLLCHPERSRGTLQHYGGSATGFLDSARNDAYEMPSTIPENAPLLCPRCKVPLKDVRTSGGVFYGCDVCGGRAVTIELLRKRFTPESINPLWLHAMRGEGRVGLPCPSCWQPMIGVALSDQAEINVDVCQHCHFIWFDAHEVDTLVPRQPEPVAPELPQKAREMLAIAEVERLSKQAGGVGS
jgi:Zn-finger nucleic acid-binding protein